MRIPARALVLFALALAACNDGISGPQRTLVLVGRLERGMTVRVGMQLGTDGALEPVTEVAVNPSDAAQVLPSGDLLLTRSGPVTVTARSSDGTVVNSFGIAAPPVIVFDGLINANRDIYKVAIDGAELVRLTTNDANEQHPSATGNLVLFTSFRDGNAELYTVALDGTGIERRITTTGINETLAELSPSGKRIVYADNATGFSKIFIATFDPALSPQMGTPARLTPTSFGNAGTFELSPTFAPASDKVALTTTATSFGGAGLFVAAAAANSVPVLVAGSGTSVEVEPAWSADGFFIAYAAPVGTATEIFARDLRSNVITQVTKAGGSNGQPAWLPDGRLVFTTVANGIATLSWVDLSLPLEIHPIPINNTSAEHPAPTRP